MPKAVKADELVGLLDYLTPEELDELDGLLGSTVPDFRTFVNEVNPKYQWYRHCQVLADVLEDVANGKRKRVMVFMPPRHGKSELVSRLFSAYYLAKHPDRWVGLNSYAAQLAYTLSRAARGYYRRSEREVSEEAAAMAQWETIEGGGMWAAGVGGPITGKGFHVGIIDDPIKNAEEANSPTIREAHKEWYNSTFYTRAEPDAAVVVIQTRWHEGDLAGWLLTEEEGEEPEKWHIVDFPAIAEPPPKSEEDDHRKRPDTCTVEPDWRKPGEALCPERYDEKNLARIRARGEYYWAALYQQTPHPREGALFKREWFGFVDQAPLHGPTVRSWDTGATAGAGDFTVGTKLRRTKDGTYYIMDVVRDQWATGERDRQIRHTAEMDGPEVTVLGQQEPGASGKDVAIWFRKMLDGFTVKVSPATGDKVIRAEPMASSAEGGNIKLVRGDWNKTFLDEMCDFPYGQHDDQPDAASWGFNYLARSATLVVGPGNIGVGESYWRQAG